jgi:CxxC motif-containing protein (DUF1111 family)
MRFLSPPPARIADARGAALFDSIKCTACHTATLKTGPNANPALANQTLAIYSDLLLHRMGPKLADGIVQGRAQGDQWRTSPLWGLGARPFWLHDGRATTIDQAIREHGGESAASEQRYEKLSPSDRNALLAFLRGL